MTTAIPTNDLDVKKTQRITTVVKEFRAYCQTLVNDGHKPDEVLLALLFTFRKGGKAETDEQDVAKWLREIADVDSGRLP